MDIVSRFSEPITKQIMAYCIEYANDSTAACAMYEQLGTRVNPGDFRLVRAQMSQEELYPPKPVAPDKRQKPFKDRAKDVALDEFVSAELEGEEPVLESLDVLGDELATDAALNAV